MRIDVMPLVNSKASVNKIVHNVHILDASGSMAGGKYINALKGIQSDLEEQRNAPDDGVLVTNTVVEFSGRHSHLDIQRINAREHYFMVPAANCTSFKGAGAGGGTPLFQAVGETIEKLVKHKKSEDKVIIKIFTDGEENESVGIYKNTGTNWKPKSEALGALIKQVEDHHNFTVTFMGTERDVENMIQNFHLDVGNTLTHDNTELGVMDSYQTASLSTMKYRGAVSKGMVQERLRKGFFKGISEEDKNK